MSKKKITVLSVLLEILSVLREISKVKPSAAVVPIATERYVVLKDGWTRDTKTGLEWGQSSDRLPNFSACEKFCVESGGRMPTVNEYLTLIDRTKHNPATDISCMKSDWYAASDPVVWSAGDVWCVGFGSGRVSYGCKDNYYYVRPVRSSQ